MRVLCLALMATATVLVQSPASGLTTTVADTAQTATSILTPVLAGEPNKHVTTRSLRTHPIADSDDGEERLLNGITDFVKYHAGKMNPEQLYKYLKLQGRGQEAYKHKNYASYIKKSKKWWKNQ
ncbi:hypothetical protein GN958_ATG00707 [Phytophthora infestans]|uniref:RxLR effector protein n=1 Tax=Phytophthora infestans TaxID=4787 RepID=A0A8S9VB59_PHYIN|nr:hypothetical protein GN958_ATG00707 [Phytophthora infestans]